jgi:hypothetical protein
MGTFSHTAGDLSFASDRRRVLRPLANDRRSDYPVTPVGTGLMYIPFALPTLHLV